MYNYIGCGVRVRSKKLRHHSLICIISFSSHYTVCHVAGGLEWLGRSSADEHMSKTTMRSWDNRNCANYNNYLFSRAARVAVYSSALWSFFMKKTITIACTAIAVTITTPNTPPRGATASDPLLSDAGTVYIDKNIFNIELKSYNLWRQWQIH